MGFGELFKFGVVSCLSAVGLNGSVDCSELFKWGSVTCLLFKHECGELFQRSSSSYLNGDVVNCLPLMKSFNSMYLPNGVFMMEGALGGYQQANPGKRC